MKNFRIILFLPLIFWAVFSYGQLSSAEMKVYKKCEKLYTKKKYADAIARFEPVVKAHPDACNVWGAFLKYKFGEYISTKKFSYNLTVTTSSDDTSSEASKKSVAELIDLLMHSREYTYLGALKSSTLRCENDRNAQIHLRVLTVDDWYNPDTNVNNVAKDHYETAETHFAKEEYDEAIKFYKKALAKQPNYKAALVHLGDCYYMQKKYDKAIEYFKDAATKYPKLLEPQKFLTDAYLHNGDDEDAVDAAAKGIMVYPDNDMFERYATATKESTGTFNRHWMVRGAKVATWKKQHFYVDFPVEGAWKDYESAKKDIKTYCDTTPGIIKDTNNITKAQYLEVYAWEKMLKNASGEEFEFAKKMQALGYLDCYVLISLFQVDLYDQEQDFVSKNPEKVKEYLKILSKEKD
ncbi:MAG: tetratricopeptide repeat protein [Bacteroidia bacterium]|nr:tetratricopeptide repeat protein [Bacteroidia bacterium]